MIPPPAQAVEVDLVKLTHYALDPEHDVGGHKALVFQSALGITADDAILLRDELLRVANDPGVIPVEGVRTAYGQLYRIDFPMTTPTGTATIRSGWIIHHGQTVFRLTTCFVLPK